MIEADAIARTNLQHSPQMKSPRSLIATTKIRDVT